VQQPALDLWRRAVFVGWDGVLARSRFWPSILDDDAHPLHVSLQARLAELLADDARLAEWLTGRRGADDVVAGLGVEPVGRYTTSYLRGQLDRDHRTTPVNVRLLRALRAVRDRAFVVVAADGSDSFAQGFRRLAARRGRWRETRAETLAAWATCCDELLCSSEIGTLTAEDPAAFFGPYLHASGLAFADALLIDGRADQCAAFRALGGTAIRWELDDPLDPLTEAMQAWVSG